MESLASVLAGGQMLLRPLRDLLERGDKCPAAGGQFVGDRHRRSLFHVTDDKPRSRELGQPVRQYRIADMANGAGQLPVSGWPSTQATKN